MASRSTHRSSLQSDPTNSPSSSTIDPVSFYGGPSSSSSLGSSHTAYIPPESPPYREPELVAEEPVPHVSRSPSVWPESSAASAAATNTTTSSTAATSATVRWEDPGPTPWDTTDNASWTANLYSDPSSSLKIPIDGRSEDEELNWSDSALLATRPGPGLLPPVLSLISHDPDHALYSVSIGNISTFNNKSPTIDEARTAIPHPNAYYCREHNGWILISWKSSSVLPPLARSFDDRPPLPDMPRRKRTISCVADDEHHQQPFGQANLTHHWHRYERAVESSKLNPPYTHDNLLLDLYLCCQCSMYCLVSEVIPGVIPLDLVEQFTSERFGNPALEKTPKATVLAGWETIVTQVSLSLSHFPLF